jgi:selenium-binding protein 1
MTLLQRNQTFYATARDAMKAPEEAHGYVALAALPTSGRADGIGVVDLDRSSPTYGTLISRVDMTTTGDELHHFGWNACSAALCPDAPHPHAERRYLVVPGLRSSRITILDTKPDPLHPRVHRVIDAAEIAGKAGYLRPHTVRCGPEALYISALGSASNGDGPGGIFRLDSNTFDVLGPWEKDHGPQHLAYDFWWHLRLDVLVSSEWGTPSMVEGGLVPELLQGKKYGRAIHLWDLRKRTHLQTLEVGEDDQMVLELRPAHNPEKEYGFVGVVTNVGDLSSSTRSSRSRRSPPTPQTCRPFSRGSGLSLPWSPTSACRWMIAICTFRAGAQGS